MDDKKTDYAQIVEGDWATVGWLGCTLVMFWVVVAVVMILWAVA